MQANKTCRRQSHDDWEWQYSCLRRNKSDQAIAAEACDAINRESFNGHAYRNNELDELRKLLKLGRFNWPDDVLHPHLDCFAFKLGHAIRFERTKSATARAREIQRRLIKPAQALLEALQDEDFAKELTAPWQPLNSTDVSSLVSTLTVLNSLAHDQIKDIREESARGKSRDASFKQYFLYELATLCEHLKPAWKPTRNDTYNKGFRAIAELIAAPLFSKPLSMRRAVRVFVDNWNARTRQVLRRLALAKERRFKLSLTN